MGDDSKTTSTSSLSTTYCYKYRITGELAGRRIKPMLKEHSNIDWQEAYADETQIDFVWETHLPRHWKSIHEQATVLNRLSNSVILENKAHFALLQSRMNVPTLETFILRGHEVEGWMNERWRDHGGVSAEKEHDWWIIKATGANGGMDVHVINPHLRVEVLQKIHTRELYVIQRYILRPMLYHGRKFHFRCYALIRGHGPLQPYLYRQAYILAASKPYHLHQGEDDLIHLTNLSVNKVTKDYPGEIPVDLPRDYPQAWEKMKEVWTETVRAAAPFMAIQAWEKMRDVLSGTVRAAAPFMAVQTSPDHFEFFGLDFIMDQEQGHAWLLEINRLPGITSSKQNQEEEDRFFDGLVRDVLRLCVVPVLRRKGGQSNNEKGGQEGERHRGGWEAVAKPDVFGGESVGEAGEIGDERMQEGRREVWKNVLRFAMYARKAMINMPNNTLSQKEERKERCW